MCTDLDCLKGSRRPYPAPVVNFARPLVIGAGDIQDGGKVGRGKTRLEAFFGRAKWRPFTADVGRAILGCLEVLALGLLVCGGVWKENVRRKAWKVQDNRTKYGEATEFKILESTCM